MIPIIVSTCPEYKKYIDPFLFCWDKFEDKFVATDYGVKEWGVRWVRLLDKIDSDLFLYLQEDYFLTGESNWQRIDELITEMRQGHWDYLRLVPVPPPQERWVKGDVGFLEKGEPYRYSLQASIWRTDYMKSCILSEDTPWSFETRKRKHDFGVHYSVTKPLMHYLPKTGVVKGKVTQEAKDYLENIGFPSELTDAV